jgi:fructan beta-fructosidase
LEGSFSASQTELAFTVDLKKTTANSFGIKLQNDLGEHLLVNFNKEKGTLEVDRTNSSKDKFSEDFFKNIHSAPLDFGKKNMDVRIIIDAASIEIFINDGELNFTSIFFPTKNFETISYFAKNGNWNIKNAKVYPLKSIWGGK